MIANLFDSVYVSLYKGLGGLAGAVLVGSSELIAAARVWRRRHGGTLPHLFALAAGALPAMEAVSGQMPRFLAQARSLAAALAAVPEIEVVPSPPQTPLFHLHLRADPDLLWERCVWRARSGCGS